MFAPVREREREAEKHLFVRVNVSFSVSYGDDEPSLKPAYMSAVNAYFAAMGARGVTLLFASGDSGVGGNVGCGPQNQFVPSFPAGAPWVTAVGGTTLS